MSKRVNKGKHIVAQSMTLLEASGKTRIVLAAREDGANISLFGDGGRSIDLMAGPDGGLHLRFHDDSNGKVAAGLAITAENRPALFLYDHHSGCRTELGSTAADGSHELTLVHRGKRVWTTDPAAQGKQQPGAARAKSKS